MPDNDSLASAWYLCAGKEKTKKKYLEWEFLHLSLKLIISFSRHTTHRNSSTSCAHSRTLSTRWSCSDSAPVGCHAPFPFAHLDCCMWANACEYTHQWVSAADRTTQQQQQQEDLPGAHKVGPVVHDDLRETDFGFRIVASKVIETADQRCTKDIGQVLAVYAALALHGHSRRY